MEQGLYSKLYLTRPRTGRDLFASFLSVVGLGTVAWAITQAGSPRELLDVRSIIIVGLGTLATTLLQYDFRSLISTIVAIFRSFFSVADPTALKNLKEVDDAIMKNEHLATLRDGERVDGELLNDVVFMYNRGLLFDEINQFVTARIEDEYANRRIAAEVLRRAALTAPALGLFGTVIGLMGVLRSMDDPTQIGPQMSLALMTTAYGAGLGSLVFTPLAGRLDHHNSVYLETHRQLLSRIGILLSREEREFSVAHVPRNLDDEAE